VHVFETPQALRCDLLASRMKRGKHARVSALLHAWRRVGVLHGRAKLEQLDRRITEVAAYLQKRGLKPNRSARYRASLSALRGWLKSEVNRCLNRLTAALAPAEIIVDRLDFCAPGLNRRLNRLISNMGRGFIEAELKDLEERIAIRCTRVTQELQSFAVSHDVDARLPIAQTKQKAP
jgi:hypothetical protein